MLDTDAVLYDVQKAVARITLNRPDVLNALNSESLQRLASILDRAKTDKNVKAMVITGAGGRAFSAGADIRFLNQATWG